MMPTKGWKRICREYHPDFIFLFNIPNLIELRRLEMKREFYFSGMRLTKFALKKKNPTCIVEKPQFGNQLKNFGVSISKPNLFRRPSEKNENSWFWKDFNEVLNFIKNNSSWIIGNGEEISVWDCNWIQWKEGLTKPKSTISCHTLFERFMGQKG